MSRHIKQLNENIYIVWGQDHALGGFFQIFDKRFENDNCSEPVFDHDELFGINYNKINLDFSDPIKVMTNYDLIINKCDEAFKTSFKND